MLDLLRLCDQEGIRVFWRSLDPEEGKLLGMYFRSRGGHPVIVLDESLQYRIPLGRSVLGEEIAHYYTTPTVDHVNHGPDSSLSKQARWRDESRALRLAANLLIPTSELAEAARKGIFLPHELAEYFTVEEYIVWRKFHVLRTDLREQWKLRVAAPDIMSPLLVGVMWGEAC